MSLRELDRRDGMADRVTIAEILSRYKRVVIAGGPKTGKSTLASSVTDRPVFHTDELAGERWEDIPELVKAQVEGKDAFVVEGVQAGRALRKGLEADVVVYLTEPRAPRTKGQQTMGKGCATIFRDYLSSGPAVPIEYDVEA